MAVAEDLIGAWSLVSWIIRLPDRDDAVQPFGADAAGRIHYSPDGYMSATISRAGRVAPLGPEDARRILKSYMHYTGRWSFADDVVTHDVDFALDPSIRGRKLDRTVSLSGDILTLRGEDVSPVDGRRLGHVLTWRRVRD